MLISLLIIVSESKSILFSIKIFFLLFSIIKEISTTHFIFLSNSDSLSDLFPVNNAIASK